MRRHILDLNQGWRFCRGEAKRFESVPHMLCYDMTKTGCQLGVMEVFEGQNHWRDVRLPHDWCTEEPCDREAGIPNNGYKRRGVGWYYLKFLAPDFTDDESLLLEFEGVMGDCLIYVNGARALRNHSGYNGFYADVTAYLKPDAENTLAVRVDNTAWEGWWYEGAGLYRPVRLIRRPSLHFGHLSPFAKPILEENGWKVCLSASVQNSAESPMACRAGARLLADNGDIVAEADLGEVTVPALGEAPVEGALFPREVRLWDLDSPNLYRVEFTLQGGAGEVIDASRVRCGFRAIAFTADRGMLLNGRPVPVNGICCHQDHAGVGIAVSRTLLRYRVEQLKAMGCNAYRCAHHEPWEALMDICDELGMLVMTENRHFNLMDETGVQLQDMVLRARNHPSAFLYCLFNEEYWQEERRGYLIAREMARAVRALDDSRPITAAMNGGVLTEKNASDVTDVAGLNYFVKDFGRFAQRCPGKPLVGTENGPIFGTRGESVDDASRQVFGGYADRTSPTGELFDETMDAAAAAPHVAGVFMWGGFDYRGEPFPFTWPSVFSHWGFTDMCGFRKDSSYLLEAWYSDAPMVHLTPHWNQRPGSRVRVCAFTNGARVELFLNGRSLGERIVDHRRAEWQVDFEPGTLQARATMADGTVISCEQRTAGQPARLTAEVIARPDDALAIVNVALEDSAGTLVPLDDRIVHIHVENGDIAGIGNGDPNAAHLPDVSDELPTFHGRCQVLIRRGSGARVTLSADGVAGWQAVLDS